MLDRRKGEDRIGTGEEIKMARVLAKWRAVADRVFASKCVADVKRHRDQRDAAPIMLAQEWIALAVWFSVEIAICAGIWFWCKKEGWL